MLKPRSPKSIDDIRWLDGAGGWGRIARPGRRRAARSGGRNRRVRCVTVMPPQHGDVKSSPRIKTAAVRRQRTGVRVSSVWLYLPVRSAVRRGGYRGRARAEAAAKRDRRVDGVRWLYPRHRCEERPGIDQGLRVDRERVGNDDNSIVEVIVIPKAADPRGVRRICICRRCKPDEDSNENGDEQRKRGTHPGMISQAARRCQGLRRAVLLFYRNSRARRPPSTPETRLKVPKAVPRRASGAV